MTLREKLSNFHFMDHRKIYYIVTVTIILVTIIVGLVRGYNFGIDFTGGTIIHIEMGKKVNTEDVKSVMDSAKVKGTSVTYAGEGNTQVLIKSPKSLKNEERSAVVDALKAKFNFDDKDVISISNRGPSVGKTMRTSAGKAIAVSVVLMLIYIAVRFMWKYGVAAILALINTLLIVIGFYGFFHISINSPFIAAMLTILGYGINDTIVIFDRIRENTGITSRKSVSGHKSMIDESIRQTIGRSLMTSLTTIAVMIPLLIFCGSTIRNFILPLLIGVIASTLSSIFIATSLWYDIVRLTDTNSYESKLRRKEKNKKAAKKEKTVSAE